MSGRRSGVRSDQQMRDDASNEARMEAYGKSNFMFMRDCLARYLGRHFSLSVVSRLANETASQRGYKIDRCSRRKFDILMLWLFERWDDIGDSFI